ncbi:XRE family transcriptional regulator [Corynebacterium sp. LK30]|uniref:helix-turn-helix domain-containing protein n=1 Tax=unclassified Corynebacterium TaxID=2624378 RepID=UPI0008A2766E|nr:MULTISPECIES: helix-turn-helix transcriptional regulator [unclassified Corynebacterium]MBC6807578.1 XRE family transcriptional regulator [Corynebacterium sp. LK30]MDU4703689.1 helix-turn-helix transcriptional regulator [Corynebacterium sp.]
MTMDLTHSQRIADRLARYTKAMREDAGLSQEEFAEKVGAVLEEPITRLTVSRIERGTRSISAPELAAIAQVLGVSITDMYAGSSYASLTGQFEDVARGLEKRKRSLDKELMEVSTDLQRVRRAQGVLSVAKRMRREGVAVEGDVTILYGFESLEAAVIYLAEAIEFIGIEDPVGVLAGELSTPVENLLPKKGYETLEKSLANAVRSLAKEG